MTKRERVLAALHATPVDRPPISFWRHVPEIDHDPKLLAGAMLDFHRRWDLDLVKVMSSGVYCVEDWGCRVAYAGSPNGAKQCTEHAVKAVADWARIRPLDPGAGALGRELEALRRIVAGRGDDAPVLMTVFTPLTIARKLAGDRLGADLAAHPDEVMAALEVITETTARLAVASVGAGAHGVFLATQSGNREAATEAESARFDQAPARRIVERVPAPAFTLLHVHGRDVYFDAYAALGAQVLNWHDRLTAPTLAEGRRRTGRAVAGGLGESRTLRTGPPAAVAAEVADAVAQTGGLGLIVTPGCVLPLDVPDQNLEAAVAAVKSPTLSRSPR